VQSLHDDAAQVLSSVVITMIHTWNNMEEDAIRNKLQALSFCLAGVCLIPVSPKKKNKRVDYPTIPNLHVPALTAEAYIQNVSQDVGTTDISC